MRKTATRTVAAVIGVGLLATGVLIAIRVLGGGDRDDVVGPACDEGPTVPGIDVSYHQETIAWRRVREAGIRFAFVRVSDGLTVIDPMFRANWDGAKQARVARGAYQFFRPEQSATDQADVMIEALRRDPGELPPAIDVEVTGGRSRAQVAAAIRAWIDRVRDRAGVEPIVYTSPDFWGGATGNLDVSAQALWVAHYTSGCPRVPAPWTEWRYWQHSKTGKVPGIRRPVDLNVFAGSIDELLAQRRAVASN